MAFSVLTAQRIKDLMKNEMLIFCRMSLCSLERLLNLFQNNL